MSISGTAVAFGKYQLTKRIGRGGMAEVWKARITGPAGFNRTLVVKRILPHISEDQKFVRMFIGEARLSALLHHPNIVQVFELGEVGGEYFMAMEYVEGRDFASVIREQLKRGMPDPGVAALVVRDMCRALAYAHGLTDENGVPLQLIHRDVSPSNVMVSRSGAVKLLDFGIAKAMAESTENNTQTGVLKGKLRYLAPEYIDHSVADHRADLFATGVVLHEALTGRPLFKGDSAQETLALVREAKVEAPSLANPRVPPELDRICLRALARNPDERYPNGDAMAAELDEVLFQLRWGTDQLGALMQELFPPERDEISQPATLTTDTSPAKGQLGDLKTQGGRSWLTIVLGALAVASMVGVLVISRGGEYDHVRRAIFPGETRETVSRPVAPPPITRAPKVEPLEEVTVRLTSQPAGAQVFLDDEKEPRTRTPGELHLPRGEQTHRLTLIAANFRPAIVPVTTTEDSQVVVPLSPTQVEPAPAPSPSSPLRRREKATRARSHASKKSSHGDSLKGDEVVDPFVR